jgi:hypothetical protein
VGETWQQLIAKVVLLLVGAEAKEACRVDQLCADLKARIEGRIHVIQLQWELMKHQDEWGFLLIDEKDAFNEGNCLDGNVVDHRPQMAIRCVI